MDHALCSMVIKLMNVFASRRTESLGGAGGTRKVMLRLCFMPCRSGIIIDTLSPKVLLICGLVRPPPPLINYAIFPSRRTPHAHQPLTLC